MKKFKFMLLNLFYLRFYLILKPKFICPTIYCYLWGTREKYILFNLSILVEILFKLQKFIKYALNYRNSFCFVSFNSNYIKLTKQLALETQQSYITGFWVESFFSRFMPNNLKKKLILKNLSFNLIKTTTPIFIFISLDKTEGFLREIEHLHTPLIAITGVTSSLTKFMFPVVCDSFSLEMIFFYSRLLVYFLKLNGKTN